MEESIDIIPVVIPHPQCEYLCDVTHRFFPLEEMFYVEDMLISSHVTLQEVTEYICPISTKRYLPHQLSSTTCPNFFSCPQCASVQSIIPQQSRYLYHCSVCEWHSTANLIAISPSELDDKLQTQLQTLPCHVVSNVTMDQTTPAVWNDIFIQLQKSLQLDANVKPAPNMLYKNYTIPDLPQTECIEADAYLCTQRSTTVVPLLEKQNENSNITSYPIDSLPLSVSIGYPVPATSLLPKRISLIPSIRMRLPTTKTFVAQIDLNGTSTNATTMIPSLYIHRTKDVEQNLTSHFLQFSIVLPFQVKIQLEVVSYQTIQADISKQKQYYDQQGGLQDRIELLTISDNEITMIQKGISSSSQDVNWSAQCVVYPELDIPEFDVTMAHARNAIHINQNITKQDIMTLYSSPSGKALIDDQVNLLDNPMLSMSAHMIQDDSVLTTLQLILSGTCNVMPTSTTIKLPHQITGNTFFKLTCEAQNYKEVEEINNRTGTKYQLSPKVVYCLAKLH